MTVRLVAFPAALLSLEVSRHTTMDARSEAFINRLPQEILLRILSSIASDRGLEANGKVYYGRLNRLSKVCRSWSTLIDQSPTLWSFIHSDLDKSTLQKSLNKSNHAPLDITLWDRSSYENTPYPVAYIWSTVLPHKTRWRTAEFLLAETECLESLGKREIARI